MIIPLWFLAIGESGGLIIIQGHVESSSWSSDQCGLKRVAVDGRIFMSAYSDRFYLERFGYQTYEAELSNIACKNRDSF